MVISYFEERKLGPRDYVNNFYRTHKFENGKILVTTDHGAWVLLDEEEYRKLRLHKVHEDSELFEELKNKGIILNIDNIKNVISDYRKRKHFLFQGPSLHIITTTMRCNQRCMYCHSHPESPGDTSYDLDKETADHILDFIFKSPSKKITIEFQGGEPTINLPVIEHIIDRGREIADSENVGLDFNLVTNLTAIDEEVLEALSKREIKGLSTSLDGPKELHNKQRVYFEGGGTYDDVVKWIKEINEKWEHDFNLNAMPTITRYSFDYGQEIVDTYLDLGFNNVWLRPLNNMGFASDTWEEIGYTSEEYLDFYKDTLDYILKKNREGEKIMDIFAVIVLKKILQKRDPTFVDMMSPCGAGISQVLYKYNGEIYTCDEGKVFEEFKLGNVREDSYEEVFNSKTLEKMIDISSKLDYPIDNSAWFPFVGVCPVYTYAAQGNIVSKLALDERYKIFKGVVKIIFKKLLFSEKDREVFFEWLDSQEVL